MIVLGPEPGHEQRAAVEDALIGEVVDGVEARAAVQRLRPFDGVQVDGDERGLPVVGVHDVGKPGERLRELERAARQEREALEVVAVALRRRSIEVRPIEVVMVLEEVDRDVATG